MNWRIALYVLLGLAGFIGLRQCSRDPFASEQASQQWQQLRRTNQAWQKRMAALRTTADSAIAASIRHERRANTWRDSALHQPPLPLIVPASCAPWADRLTLCQRETGALRDALAAERVATVVERERGDSAKQRADSLTVLIPKLPKPCKLLGVRCEYIAVGVGVIVGSQLK